MANWITRHWSSWITTKPRKRPRRSWDRTVTSPMSPSIIARARRSVCSERCRHGTCIDTLADKNEGMMSTATTAKPSTPGWYYTTIDDISMEPGWGKRYAKIYYDGEQWNELLQSEIVVDWHDETPRQDGGE